jgi:hypothetical protein
LFPGLPEAAEISSKAIEVCRLVKPQILKKVALAV